MKDPYPSRTVVVKALASRGQAFYVMTGRELLQLVQKTEPARTRWGWMDRARADEALIVSVEIPILRVEMLIVKVGILIVRAGTPVVRVEMPIVGAGTPVVRVVDKLGHRPSSSAQVSIS